MNYFRSKFSWLVLACMGISIILSVPVPAMAQLCIEPPEGLVAWWRGERNAKDNLSVNNGKLMNGIMFRVGKVGRAFTLDGIDDRIEIPHNDNLNPTGPFSVEAWFKASSEQLSSDGLFTIIDKSHGFIDGTGWVLSGNQGGPGCSISMGRECVPGEMQFAFGMGGSTGDPANFIGVGTGVSILDNRFHHVAGVFTADTLEIYLDGILKESRPHCGLPANNTRPVLIGASYGGGTPSRHFHGRIDEVSYYNRALTASDIQGIVNAANAGKCAPSVAGLVSGITPTKVVCQNITTGQKVIIQDRLRSWSCESAGLMVHPGDRIRQTIQGKVDGP